MPHLPLIPRGSKFAFHSVSPGQVIPFTTEAVSRDCPLALVKSMHNFGVALDVKRISPATLTVVRLMGPWHTAHDIEKGFFPYALAAQETIDHIFQHTSEAERAATDRFEVLNEPDPPGEQGYHNLALFMLALMDEAERRGVRLALPALNAGTPEYYEMLAMLETGVFERMTLGGHWLSIHEGVFGLDEVNKGFGVLIPGAPFVPPGAGALCFRYRYLLDLIKRRHGRAPAIVVSEFLCGGGYENQQTAEGVLQRFAWYDHGVRTDPEVLGVCPFTPDPGGWVDQNYNYILPAMLDYMQRIKDQPNAVESAPPTEPEWPGLARVLGLVGSNLRSGPGGLIVGAAWSGKVIRIIGPAGGDWLETRLFIHKSRVTRL